MNSQDIRVMSPSSTLMSEETLAGVETIRTFEPTVNTPALVSFVIIAVIFSLLQLRINGISRAVSRRSAALTALRDVKASELTVPDVGKGEGVSVDVVAAAVKEYEAALEEEEAMRTVFPGVRIVAPNAAGRSAEDVAAARQFLARDLKSEAGITSEEDRMPGNKEMELEDDPKRGFSNVAIGTLALVAFSQILLLFILSLDPMKANDVFTELGGPPPADIPLSSW